MGSESETNEHVAQPSLSPVEQAAVRKLIDRLDPKEMAGDETMVDRAKRVGNEFERVQEQVNTLSNQLINLTEQVEELQASVSNDDYQDLTREQKRLRVKRLVQETAKQNNGKGAVDYAEIRAAFNKQIPEGSAHYLMEQIAEEPGYSIHNPRDANKKLRVDVTETDQQLFSSEKSR